MNRYIIAAALTLGVSTAHAQYFHGTINGVPFSGYQYNGPSGFGAGFAQGFANSMNNNGDSSDPLVQGHSYWSSFDGAHHDCAIDPPFPLAVAFGAKCRRY